MKAVVRRLEVEARRPMLALVPSWVLPNLDIPAVPLAAPPVRGLMGVEWVRVQERAGEGRVQAGESVWAFLVVCVKFINDFRNFC